MPLTKPWLKLLLATTTAVANADRLSDGIVEWVRSKGGYFSEKIAIRGMDPNDPSSPLGVFANGDLEKGEIIVEIPHSCYITLPEEERKSMSYNEQLCNLSHLLLEEMKLGSESEFAPYTEYIMTQQRGQLPATWSKAGKDALRAVAFQGSDIVDWITDRFGENGENHCVSDKDEEHAMALSVQRGYDSALIPIWDMFNHWNGNINTENDSIWDGNKLVIRTAWQIEEGEELYASYDSCLDCQDLDYSWGTQEILRDFGFVEFHPHRWIFEGKSMWFEVWRRDQFDEDEEYEGISIGEYLISWETEYHKFPGDEGITLLKEEVQRLERVAQEELKEQGSIPDHEWNNIKQFHEAVLLGTKLAIESAKTPSTCSSSS